MKPYEAIFDTHEKIGLNFIFLPENIVDSLKSDEDLETLMNSISIQTITDDEKIKHRY